MDRHRPVARFLWLVTALVLALAGCSDDETSPDTTAPAAVSDLAATASSHEEVVLTFTYTGDSGTSGTASQCDIRYSTTALTEANFASATALASPPVPTGSGTAANVTVSGLTPETEYYFAVKLADEVPNWSEMSNVATATTQAPPDVTPPTQVADLTVSVQPGANSVTLSWTAPTDPAKSVVAYSLRYTTDATDLDESTWAEATEVAGLPAPDPGNPQEVTVSDLPWDTTYHFTVTAHSDFTDPSTGTTTRYESLLFPKQVTGPGVVYPVG